MDGWLNAWMDGWLNAWMDGWLNAWMDDGLMEEEMSRWTNVRLN